MDTCGISHSTIFVLEFIFEPLLVVISTNWFLLLIYVLNQSFLIPLMNTETNFCRSSLRITLSKAFVESRNIPTVQCFLLNALLLVNEYMSSVLEILIL